MTIDFSGVPWFWLMIFVACFVLPSIRRMKGRGAPRELGGGAVELERSRREMALLRSELEERLVDVDTLHARVAELENRLDFTERLLAAQPRAPESAGVSIPLQ